MSYVMLIFEPEEYIARRTDPEHKEAFWNAWGAYHKAMVDAGVITGGAALEHHSTATTVRLRNGERQVQDGPFVDAKEQLGGIMILDVPDLDTALEWAARCPAAEYGTLEVRPKYQMSGQ
ncbi:MAG: YciI family protein [Pseudomonadota bacterium]